MALANKEFMNKLLSELKATVEFNEKRREDELNKLKEQRLANEQKCSKELKKQLRKNIENYTHIPVLLGGAFGQMIKEDWQLNIRDFRLLLAPLGVISSQQTDFSLFESYRGLAIEDKRELYDLFVSKLKNVSMCRVEDYMEQMDIEFHQPLTSEQKGEILIHLKTFLSVVVKGVIFEDKPYYYTHEALPSILEVLDMSRPTWLHDIQLFKSILQWKMEEEGQLCIQVLKDWYQEKGKYITSFEALVQKEIENGRYDDAVRHYKTYSYLFQQEVRDKQKQQLVDMIHERYQQYQQAQKEKGLHMSESVLRKMYNDMRDYLREEY